MRRFSEKVRRMIYSTNRMERLNRSYKRTLLMRGAMPSPLTLIRPNFLLPLSA